MTNSLGPDQARLFERPHLGPDCFHRKGIIYSLGNKAVLYLICNRITVLLERKTEKRNSQFETGTANGGTRGLFYMCDLGESAVNHNISVTPGE